MKRKHTEKAAPDLRQILRTALPVLLIAVLAFSCTPPGKALWHRLSAACGLAHFTEALPEDELHIHVIDVGKADAILIESPESAVLVDCGTAAEAQTVLRYLSARGIEKLDAVWISHPDSDHRGGLSEILEAIPADRLVEKLDVKTGQIYEIGDLLFEVVTPPGPYSGTNDSSMVFRLVYGEFSMLFCGDIEDKAERDLLQSGAQIKADVLKVAHHGSATSTSSEFLEAVQPQYAVISTAEDRNNLPRNAVLKRLSDADVQFYRTDRDGSVVFSTDGSRIRVITENQKGSFK